MTSGTRSKILPDVPTLMEQGVSNFDVSVFFAIMAPAHTPKDIIKKLNSAFVTVMQDPEVRKNLEAQGLEIATQTSSEDLAKFIRVELDQWRKVIKVSGAQAD